ncbi:hypothetical protein BJ508DRAFT_72702 [Ascobolus immersus RN42]|uniref:NWD NACHT-NTPase N-terminal domain-containing protein n=1 Tax=Ascobolus immersus RN42 TaxID=1160509 RepID=A0A3N4HEA8_ASCIM|nr:hypothetical protein BJ508DRAFT_72702 [Ascobolus immersus RN42]
MVAFVNLFRMGMGKRSNSKGWKFWRRSSKKDQRTDGSGASSSTTQQVTTVSSLPATTPSALRRSSPDGSGASSSTTQQVTTVSSLPATTPSALRRSSPDGSGASSSTTQQVTTVSSLPATPPSAQGSDIDFVRSVDGVEVSADSAPQVVIVAPPKRSPREERDQLAWTRALEIALDNSALSPIEKEELSLDSIGSGTSTVFSILRQADDLKRNEEESRWIFDKGNGEKVVLRQKFDKAVSVFSQYSKLVDTAVQQGPDAVKLVWSGVSLLMNMYLQHKEVADQITEAMETIGQSMASAAFYASIYEDGILAHLESSNQDVLDGWKTRIEEALPEYYASILSFVASAKHYFGSSEIFRFSAAPSDEPLYTEFLEAIRAREGVLKELASMANMRGVKDIGELTSQSLEILKKLLLRIEDESPADVMKWLNASDPFSLARSYQKEQLEGTCQWILRHPSFISWKEGKVEPRNLWIVGLPGQ